MILNTQMTSNQNSELLTGPQQQPKLTMKSEAKKQFAKPLQLQRLEGSLDMKPFMSFAKKILSKSIIESDNSNVDDDDENLNLGEKLSNGIKTSKQERRSDKLQVFNFSQVDSERKWLQDVLLSDTDTESEFSDEDEYIKEMLKAHVKEKNVREKFYKRTSNSQYLYYGAGLLSNYDQFPDHQRSIVGVKKRRKEREKKVKEKSLKNYSKKLQQEQEDLQKSDEIDPSDLADIDCWDDNKEDIDDDGNSLQIPSTSNRGRKKKFEIKTPEMMAARRRKMWQLMAKKEIGKVQRSRANNHKEMLLNCKRVAVQCSKVVRQKAMISQKMMKEQMWRAKRLTKEMLNYWKRYDRVEREARKRKEKEAEEQRKIDMEMMEAKRQQRKLNFLITQTELYAHFMSKKLGCGSEEDQIRILKQLDEEVNPRLASIDDYDSEAMKQKAKRNAADAFNTERARTQEFDVVVDEPKPVLPTLLPDSQMDLPQPNIFTGTLKGYQLKGMTWLANLYDQGISGILADEMGLGKTVQSIALLCHIAEHYGVWGPFLIISPASTLHNWQQEMSRFAPDFNVVPYWGSPNERKILRQFWEQKGLHTKHASFHVVITSYQLIVSDYKYFNRIKWQYLILDEAQAIKSTSSMRWKLLLGFNCRNRLLLSGTPIQNSMAELWALLHFIMPTLFDSHDEFNEWFSKDIESHAENKTGIDEKQISRLHMILKPFMLRRIKCDVENELSDKIEIMVCCPLTMRQKLLYVALKKKIKIEDLLHCVEGQHQHVDKNFTSNLMNLVMQFRKVCNHPELFERRDAKSPFSIKFLEYQMARLIFNDGILYTATPSKNHLLYNKFNIFKSENVQRSLFPNVGNDKTIKNAKYLDLNADSSFSFARFAALEVNDIEYLTSNGLISLFDTTSRINDVLKLYAYRNFWWKQNSSNKKFLLLEPILEAPLDRNFLTINNNLGKFLFISNLSTVYTIGSYLVNNMQETIEHRIIRSKNMNLCKIQDQIEIKTEDDSLIQEELKIAPQLIQCPTTPGRGRPPKYLHSNHCDKNSSPAKSTAILLPEFEFKPRKPRIFHNEELEMPKLVYGFGQKAQTFGRRFYVDSRRGEWAYIRHKQCENVDGMKLISKAINNIHPNHGWSYIQIPHKHTLISDSGKLGVLDSLLTRLKSQGHRVLIYSQMTKMIDLLEEYMWHRKFRYMRLDGSSKISARRDMVDDFQTRSDIFVFLLSTRAGGLGINLTAADTVIFYDSDWNPTVDQQAMDRAHRLGQTKQVTVYRLICKGTIEERILQRAREKSEIQRMVISGGNFKPDTLKPKEVVSLLLDDEELELRYRQKNEEKKTGNDANGLKRKLPNKSESTAIKKVKIDPDEGEIDVEEQVIDQSEASSSIVASEAFVASATSFKDEDSSNEGLVVDIDSPFRDNSPVSFSHYGVGRPRRKHHPRGTRRGRPRGSGRSGKLLQPRQEISPQPSTSDALATSSDQLIDVGEGVFQSLPANKLKRGPGRPRLKTCPPNQGYRGAPRSRKPMLGPLLVSVAHNSTTTTLKNSPLDTTPNKNEPNI